MRMRMPESLDFPARAYTARKWVLGGRVQGVGFRPFVYRVAQHCCVQGWVRNRAGDVEILAQGSPHALQRFASALLTQAPPLARPEIVSELAVEPEPVRDFQIRASEAACSARIHVPPDYFACDECLAELDAPSDRRYRYPFVNCTQCGPRYSLIERMPYDRANTSMAGFALCPLCAAEYADPSDRRFHAEPVGCAQCGPQLTLVGPHVDLRGSEAVAATIVALRAGKIVAVKGIGGYHLLCDAANSAAVIRLRARKKRPDKPLAVMFPSDLRALRQAAVLDGTHAAILRDPMRPVVLIAKTSACTLSPAIAPGSAEIGAMLPYSPLHHLLVGDFGGPLVATSGNISGEPVLTDNAEAEKRLATVADAFLHHDRRIIRPADDPVYRVIAERPRPLRLGRGNAPLEIALPFSLARPLLALGGDLKTTAALGWGRRAVVSPHLGDISTRRGLDLLKRVIADLQALYNVTAAAVICDAHPHFTSSRLARRLGLPVIPVFHHDAHASALAGEFPEAGDRLVFTWDGAGFGRDGSIWGGEALLGRPGYWRRVATMRQFSLLGGERAAREPWRTALALCWEAGTDWQGCNRDVELLRHAWQRRLNCPPTSSVGRLFDAAAALLGLLSQASYEGQAPSLLEAASGDADPIQLPLRRNAAGLWQSDWAPLVAPLLDTTRSVSARAGMFHASMAELLLAQARAVRGEHGVTRLGLTGGVFQNRNLCERICRLANRDGFAVQLTERVPCNDAGLSFGQLVEAGARA
jgi:hydrogenase maturation protein HypF